MHFNCLNDMCICKQWEWEIGFWISKIFRKNMWLYFCCIALLCVEYDQLSVDVHYISILLLLFQLVYIDIESNVWHHIHTYDLQSLKHKWMYILCFCTILHVCIYQTFVFIKRAMKMFFSVEIQILTFRNVFPKHHRTKGNTAHLFHCI